MYLSFSGTIESGEVYPKKKKYIYIYNLKNQTKNIKKKN
jgi:hypothetical protein